MSDFAEYDAAWLPWVDPAMRVYSDGGGEVGQEWAAYAAGACDVVWSNRLPADMATHDAAINGACFAGGLEIPAAEITG